MKTRVFRDYRKIVSDCCEHFGSTKMTIVFFYNSIFQVGLTTYCWRREMWFLRSNPLYLYSINTKSYLLHLVYRKFLDPTTPRRGGATRRFVRAEGVRFLRFPTSNCSHFMTTGSYQHKFHSRDNDDSYLTNLSQIFKIHVDFRVISETTQLETSNISKCSEFSGNENNAFSSARTFPNHQSNNILEIDFRSL